MAPEVAQWLGAQGTQHWLCSHPWLSGVRLPFLLHLFLLFLSLSLSFFPSYCENCSLGDSLS